MKTRFGNRLIPPNFLYDSIQVIQTLEDFENYDPNVRNIQLEDKIYFIDSGGLDITGHTLVFGQRSQINGFGQNVSAITTSDTSGTTNNKAVMFSSAKNLFMNDLEIYVGGSNNLVWQNISDGSVTEGESFELNRFAVYNFQPPGSGNKLGFVKDIRQGFMGTMFFFGFEDGFEFAGAWDGGFRIDNTLWQNCSGKFYYSSVTDPVIFARRFASNAAVRVPVGSIAYDFPSTAFVFAGQYQLQNGNASEGGTYVSDFASGYPGYDPIGNFQNNTGIENTFPGGEWINDNNQITIINTQNVWEQLNVVTSNKGLAWFSELNGVFTYLSTTRLPVRIDVILSMTGKANDIVEIELRKRDTGGTETVLATRQITIQGTTAQGRAESVPMATTTVLEFDDDVLVYVRNTSGNTDLTTLAGSNCIIAAK